MRIYGNELYKVTNTVTGEYWYCINMTHCLYLIGAHSSNRYCIMKNKCYKHYNIEEVDGSKITWGEIFKP